MTKKIKSSLFAKVFLITSVMLLCISLLVFGMLAWLMPQTYSNRLNTILDKRTQDFISELEQVPFSDSGGLFDQFVADTEINSVELYNSDGDWVTLPAKEFDNEWKGNIAQTAVAGPGETSPVLSNQYYFSFSDCSDRYTLVVYGEAEQILELQQSFIRVFPIILLLVLAIALVISWLYSRMITKPVLEISRISEKMSDLQLDWTVDEQRTDELGTLGKSLNRLSRNLSTALSDLQNANRKLEADIEHEKELEQARTNFFSAVSHELKTPVTIIKGQLEGMLLGIGAYKDREKYLTRSLEIANTLETMVQEILTISRLETVGPDFKKDCLDCVQIIKSYLSETEDLIAGKDLQIHLDTPPSALIAGNKLLMGKVFSNLIGNAIKYSPQGASIHISIHAEHEQIKFSVENTGAHIPEDSIPKLFDAFYRVEQSRSRKTGGSGLGLYIVQEILHHHGSECMVCNTQAGVKFSFTI
ncbi:sensor histidine kinase [Parablautia intestinalis]|uniref:histidine kinase n=1 Tax=Parablautia intestinalis TaxID=2320100 RepID=A0A3A9AQH4_9FIRM|nr:HAMP domain-containing sensor histidine kinase [Parablautia intestinalis]RKI89821.1 sensor histidine kinase [Parablautia intestinalis]